MAKLNIPDIAPLDLRKNNPYYGGFIFINPDETLLLERKKYQYVKSVKDKYYTVVQGDTLWNIAFSKYGDSKKWAIIADANNIENPLELQVGTSLLIPDINIHEIVNL